MSRILILLLLAVGVLWWLFGRRGPGKGKGDGDGDGSPGSHRDGSGSGSTPGTGSGRAAPRRAEAEPTQMLACAHCGVHLPRSDTVSDEAGRVFCGEAHRLAGPH